MMDTDALTAAVIDEHEAETNVKVMIRFRPENTKEVRSDTTKEFDIQYSDNEKAVKLSQTEVGKLSVERSYTFDKVFAPTATQAYVFEHLARGTVDDVVKGFNGTVFAYGQTGSGKTWSMFGINTPEGRGVIPRSAEYLFDELQRADEIKQVTIKCSFLEIYKERVRDLLNPRQTESLKLRETPRGAVRVVGLLEEYVSSPDDIMALVAAGERIRSVSKTEMNDISSRSHTLLTVTVTQKLQDASIRVGKLNMADLAGSERVDKSTLQSYSIHYFISFPSVFLGASTGSSVLIDGPLFYCAQVVCKVSPWVKPRRSTRPCLHWATASMHSQIRSAHTCPFETPS